MNIFVLDKSPTASAQMLCDKHIPKMIVESAQMMACALYENGAMESEMPLTKSGTHYKGGYKNHPCSVWAGKSISNYAWLSCHAIELCRQFMFRYKKIHACTEPIIQMSSMAHKIKLGELTAFYQAMPEEYHDKDAIKAYRNYYINEKTFAEWKKGVSKPRWMNN